MSKTSSLSFLGLTRRIAGGNSYRRWSIAITARGRCEGSGAAAGLVVAAASVAGCVVAAADGTVVAAAVEEVDVEFAVPLRRSHAMNDATIANPATAPQPARSTFTTF